jgi:poly(A) polymerase
LGVDSYRASLLLAWAQSPVGPDDRNWHSAFTLPDRWQAPTFPLRGPDIMALGELKGPEIGETLRRLERDWIEGGFSLTREPLLAKARALIAERR